MRISVNECAELNKLLEAALGGFMLGREGFQFSPEVVKKALDRGFIKKSRTVLFANVYYSLIYITDRGAARLLSNAETSLSQNTVNRLKNKLVSKPLYS